MMDDPMHSSPTVKSPYNNNNHHQYPYNSPSPKNTLRQRQVNHNAYDGSYSTPTKSSISSTPEIKVSSHKKLKRFDLFEKVESDLTVKTNSGGIVAMVAWVLIGVLSLNEIYAHYQIKGSTNEHVVVDTSLGVGRRISVNMNITFPSLSCDDVHLDVMDVAGDSHINLEEDEEHFVVKRKLKLDGTPFDLVEQVIANKAAKEEKDKEKIRNAEVPENYCGPCYGANTEERKCCNTCDDVINAYKEKRWNSNAVTFTSEQCMREGRDKKTIKRMTKGEGCNISGTLRVNKVAGNFHIAMGEAIDVQGRHIHQFVPEDAINFNASHIIHELSFGENIPGLEKKGLNGVTKIITALTGGTGVFQYFVKVVPTNFTDSNGNVLETNQYSFTERYSPLLTDLNEEHYEDGDSEQNAVGVDAGAKKKSDGHTHEYHWHQNAVLPGIFFIYDIYPFALEVTQKTVPFSHLLIRLLAVIGGTLTVFGWVDKLMYAHEKQRR